ncbi:hypothetical protein DRO54_10615 [Candidatus Bathyarchaeota archaeon]|nr:MAG: hypothetical protein DRO54_10615 [Candidatus Bathyarchaeota archaeon]
MPEGSYYCKVCGPEYIMEELTGSPLEMLIEKFESVLYYHRLPSYQEVEELFFLANRLDLENELYFLTRKYHIFEFWNRNYIECLSKEIKRRVNGNLVLEVCAGDGMLSYWLRVYGVNIKATDSGEWGIKPRNRVEIIDAISAIKKYKPIMVVASWLPYEEPLDIQIFNEGVPYIILIGETDGACGSERFWKEEYWKKAGYKEEYSDCSRFQLCRTDYVRGQNWIQTHSSTMIFTKIRGD